MASDRPSSKSSTDQFTAVIFIHGIGRHNKYQNMGRLLSALEHHVEANPRRVKGHFRTFRPAIELSSPEGGRSIPFVNFVHQGNDTNAKAQRQYFRAYESHWTPLIKQGIGWRPMIWWLMVTGIKYGFMRTSGWTRAYRLKIARFNYVRQIATISDNQVSQGKLPSLTSPAWSHVSASLKRFQGAVGRRWRNQNASVPRRKQFSVFSTRNLGGQTKCDAQCIIAHAAREKLPSEKRLSRQGFVLAFSLFAVIPAFVTLIYTAAKYFDALSTKQAVPLASIFVSIWFLGVVVLCGWAGIWFLQYIFSGVRFWVGQSEIDSHHESRRAILDDVVSLISHVTSRPGCKRVVIVSHSLGTAICYDALREIARRNAATNIHESLRVNLNLITRCITLGSPIDKIQLLFDLPKAVTHREFSTRERLLGDLSMDYLCGRRSRPLRWTNYWDSMDAVSDPLYTPLGGKTEGATVVTTGIENIRVCNSPGINAVASHTRYLDNPTVLEDIYYSLLGGIPPTAPKNRYYSWEGANLFRRIVKSVAACALIVAVAMPITLALYAPTERMAIFSKVAALSGTLLIGLTAMLLFLESRLGRWLDFGRPAPEN